MCYLSHHMQINSYLIKRFHSVEFLSKFLNELRSNTNPRQRKQYQKSKHNKKKQKTKNKQDLCGSDPRLNSTSIDQDHLQKSIKIEPVYTLKNLWESSSSHYSTKKKTRILKSSLLFFNLETLFFFFLSHLYTMRYLSYTWVHEKYAKQNRCASLHFQLVNQLTLLTWPINFGPPISSFSTLVHNWFWILRMMNLI